MIENKKVDEWTSIEDVQIFVFVHSCNCYVYGRNNSSIDTTLSRLPKQYRKLYSRNTSKVRIFNQISPC